MTIALLNKDNFIKKLGACIKKARAKNDVIISLITPPGIYDEIHEMMKNHHKIDSARIGKVQMYLVEEMRIEINKIDGYV